MRKNTLEYDDVMNIQRTEIYNFRNEILHNEDIKTVAFEITGQLCSLGSEKFLIEREQVGGWDVEGYRQWLMKHFPVSFKKGCFDDDYLSIGDIEQRATEKLVEELQKKFTYEKSKLESQMDEEDRDDKVGRLLQNSIRDLVISKIDSAWQAHLLTMDHLRSEVHLQAVAQKDPLMEFKHSAFHLFDKLSLQMRSEIAKDLFKLELHEYDTMRLHSLLEQVNLETKRSLVGEFDEVKQGEAVSGAQSGQEKKEPITVEQKVGRNDPCPCGSGKKYKKCCGKGM